MWGAWNKQWKEKKTQHLRYVICYVYLSNVYTQPSISWSWYLRKASRHGVSLWDIIFFHDSSKDRKNLPVIPKKGKERLKPTKHVQKNTTTEKDNHRIFVTISTFVQDILFSVSVSPPVSSESSELKGELTLRNCWRGAKKYRMMPL